MATHKAKHAVFPMLIPCRVASNAFCVSDGQLRKSSEISSHASCGHRDLWIALTGDPGPQWLSGVWEAKETCMQAGLQRRAAAAAVPPQVDKMAEEQEPRRHLRRYSNLTSRTRPPRPSLLLLPLPLLTSPPHCRLLLPFSLPLQICIRICIRTSSVPSGDAARLAANHCARPAAKEKRHSDPSSNARRVT
ncbi:hypothetical protein NA56DRAFT_748339 [Hyaloscypha hepaticicola]|uniref:Uncharacterized protein n=1 Tax=Hyaloscypha hepaticicola TaxID=2082293 RepID=A0A2J6Q6T5_9HELO|nr:hypothetical protein NA56DRAFT_748339 [Hyaloscypha hepaticicola]